MVFVGYKNRYKLQSAKNSLHVLHFLQNTTRICTKPSGFLKTFFFVCRLSISLNISYYIGIYKYYWNSFYLKVFKWKSVMTIFHLFLNINVVIKDCIITSSLSLQYSQCSLWGNYFSRRVQYQRSQYISVVNVVNDKTIFQVILMFSSVSVVNDGIIFM